MSGVQARRSTEFRTQIDADASDASERARHKDPPYPKDGTGAAALTHLRTRATAARAGPYHASAVRAIVLLVEGTKAANARNRSPFTNPPRPGRASTPA